MGKGKRFTDDLAGIRKSHQEALHEVGIETLTTLASLNASDLEVSDIAFSDEIESDFLKTKAIWAAKTGKEFSSLLDGLAHTGQAGHAN